MLWKIKQSSKTLLFVPYLFLPSAHLLNHTLLPRELSAAEVLHIVSASASAGGTNRLLQPKPSPAAAFRRTSAHICTQPIVSPVTPA